MGDVRPPFTVVYVDNSRTFGGAINSLVHLVRALDRSVVEPVVVSAQDEDFLRGAFPGVRVERLRTPVQWKSGNGLLEAVQGRLADTAPGLARIANRLRAGYWLLRHHLPSAVRIARRAKGAGADLIHLNNNAASQIDGILAARLLGIPCVAHAQGPQSPRWFLRRMVRIPVVHVAISGEMRDNLLALGVEPKRIVVIPHGIDLTAFEVKAPDRTLRDELGIPPGAGTFAVFGRIVPWKGILEFVEGARRVLDAMPEAVALVVGDVSDGEEGYAAAVRERIEELGLTDRILLTGFRDDVPELMRLVDCVVHTSTQPEPFGLVVVEAMAVGTPVVAADAGGPREIVVPGETGLLADPADPDALGAAILRILQDTALAERMGRAAARRARSEFSKERYASDIEALYASVLDGARRRASS